MRKIRNLVSAGLMVAAAVVVPLQAVAAVAVPPAPAAVSLGTISILDTQVPLSGIMNSATIGTDGLGIIAYRINVNNNRMNLRVAHCQDLACTAITTTDFDAGGWGGLWPSIKIGSDGLPLISYVVSRDKDKNFLDDLKVAHCNDVACTSATITTLDAPARVTKKTSLTIGADGLGLISYQSSSSGQNPTDQVKVAHCLNVACTSANRTVIATVVSLSSGWDDIGYASIATGGNGFGVVAYSAGSARELRVATCTNADCTTVAGSHTVVDAPANPSAPWVGQFASVTVGVDGLALISYGTTGGSGQLRVAHCSNATCSQSTKVTVDTVYVYHGNSIAIGADGLGVISYRDEMNKNLKVAHCTNVACSSASNKAVDEFDDVGLTPSVATGTDGLPLVAYMGPGIVGVHTLRVLHCGNADCTAPISKPF